MGAFSLTTLRGRKEGSGYSSIISFSPFSFSFSVYFFSQETLAMITFVTPKWPKSLLLIFLMSTISPPLMLWVTHLILRTLSIMLPFLKEPYLCLSLSLFCCWLKISLCMAALLFLISFSFLLVSLFYSLSKSVISLSHFTKWWYGSHESRKNLPFSKMLGCCHLTRYSTSPFPP